MHKLASPGIETLKITIIVKKLYFKQKQFKSIQQLQKNKFFKENDKIKIVKNAYICNQFT